MRPHDRLFRLLLALIAVSAAAVGFGHSVFSASVSDTSGYVAAAESLRAGRLFRPSPLQLIPAIQGSGASTSPLGFSPGVVSGTEVPVYPLGLSYLMAGFASILGPLAAYAVTPAALGMLVILAGVLANQTGGSAAGLAAALFVALDPVGILNGVWAMSDAPAAACWIGAWYFVLRARLSSVLVGGLLAALGMTIRPVLGPLAAVLALLTLLMGRRLARPSTWAWARAGAFTGTAAIGVLLVAMSQAILYGGPLRSGYPLESLYGASYVPSNLTAYPRLFVEARGYVPILLLTSALLAWRRFDARARTLVVSGVALAAVNIAVYLPYAPFHSWPFLRFFLPATTVVLIVGASGAVRAVEWATERRRSTALRWAIPALALVSAADARAEYRLALDEWFLHSRILSMGSYLPQVLPPNAVVVAYIHSGAIVYIHSGAIVHYTGKRTLGPEGLIGKALDRLVADLRSYGQHPVLVLDENVEVPAFKRLFADSEFGALDWPPRAEFTSATTILYFDFADRARFLRGDRWPVDVVQVTTPEPVLR